jgi:hypothetical protein
MTNSRDRDGLREVEPDAIKPPPHYREDHPQVLTADTVRQAPEGKRVLVVLVLSLAAVLVVWAAGGLLHWW